MIKYQRHEKIQIKNNRIWKMLLNVARFDKKKVLKYQHKFRILAKNHQSKSIKLQSFTTINKKWILEINFVQTYFFLRKSYKIMFLSNPPDTIKISVTGDSAMQVAGDWWTFRNSTTGVLFVLETVFQAATVPLLNAAANKEGFTVLIFKSRRPCK